MLVSVRNNIIFFLLSDFYLATEKSYIFISTCEKWHQIGS